MKTKTNSQSGYIGLLLLIIGLVVLVALYVNRDLFTGGKAKETGKTLESNYKFNSEEQEKSIDNLN